MSERTEQSHLTRIQGYSHSGEGVGRLQEKPVFIPLSIKGELVRFRILQEKSRYLRGELMEVLERGPGRAEPPCPLFPRCGGCQLQHQSYEEQMQFKQQLVTSSLQRLGGFYNPPVREVLGMSHPWHYRHTARFHVARGDRWPEIGYFQGRSQSLLPIDTCALLPEEFPAILSRIGTRLRQLQTPESFPAQEVTLRKGWGTGELLVRFMGGMMPDSAKTGFIDSLKDNVPGLVGIQYDTPESHGPTGRESTWGRDYYREKIAGAIFQVPAAAFFQNNPQQAARLVSVVHALAEPGASETIVDLYCGVGLFALTLAPLYQNVWGIEENRQAVDAAGQNARLNGIDNCRFLAGTVEKSLSKIAGQQVQTLILDPPRTGCSPAAIQAICTASPRRIIYVSCNPSTLARDLAILAGRGYRIEIVQPVDMFPQTYHVECVALMSRATKE